jgi:hypothetical protein
MPDHQDVISEIDEVTWLEFEFFELVDRGEDLVHDGLGAVMVAAPRKAGHVWLDPFDLRIEQLQDGRGSPFCEREPHPVLLVSRAQQRDVVFPHVPSSNPLHSPRRR